ncbi:MAG: hypothetical protein ACLP9D_12345 [Candidatus Bathyarchaeia archaeon]
MLPILVLAIVGVNFLSPTYACLFIESPSSITITQGTASVPITGNDQCDVNGSENASLFSGACPGVTLISSESIPNVEGAFGGMHSLGGKIASLSPGSYCIEITSDSSSTHAFASLTVTATSGPPIPEYPLGLAVLAVFMILAYGVIRRKTVTKQK